MKSKNQGLSSRGRMSEETFSLFLDLIGQKLSGDKIAHRLSMGRSIVSWSLRLLDKQGPAIAYEVLVNGNYAEYTQEQLNSIASLHFKYGISCEELEVSFVTSRHCITKRAERLKNSDLSLIDDLFEQPLYLVSYLKLIRAGVPTSIIHQIEKGLFNNVNGLLTESILDMLYQLEMTEQQLKKCEELALAGNGVQLLNELRQALKNVSERHPLIFAPSKAQSSFSNQDDAILDQNFVHTVNYLEEYLAAGENQTKEPVAKRFGRAEKPLKFYPRKKRARSKAKGVQFKEQKNLQDADKVLVTNNPSDTALAPNTALASKLDKADNADYRQSRILEILGEPLKRIPACEYTPGSPGPIPNVDPDSEGFLDYPYKVRETILKRQIDELKVQSAAIPVIAGLLLDKFKSQAINYLRYQVAQEVIKKCPDIKPSFIFKVLNISYRMKNYYASYVEHDPYEEIYEDVKKCFYEHDGSYGKVRLCQALRTEYGIYLSVPTVKKIMNRLNLVPKPWYETKRSGRGN